MAQRLQEAGLPQALPRGYSVLPREVVQRSQRARINEALARSMAIKGYAATTVADITALAGVSRTTFYEQFDDKHGCFMACFEDQIRYLLRRIEAAVRAQASPQHQLVHAVAAILDVAAGEPVQALAFMGLAPTVGAEALDAVVDHKARVITILRRIWREVPENQRLVPDLPMDVFQMTIHGMHEFVCSEIRAGRTAQLPRHLPRLAWLWFAALGLPQWAGLALQASPSRLIRGDWCRSPSAV